MKCKKVTPTFNYEGEKTALFCEACKAPGMINIKNTTCEKCKVKQPSFNYKGLPKKFCSDCKEIDMIDVINKKCEKCHKKIPIFNYEGETIRRFCGDCKEPGMVDIYNRICIDKSCRRRVQYALPGMLPEYCSTHRTEGMIKNPRKQCTSNPCREIATHGIKEPLHCDAHALENEYNLVERCCKKCERIDVLNMDGLCVNFCSHEEKDRIIKKQIKQHEEFIGKLLQTEINIPYIYQNEIVDKNCSKKRPDFVYHCGTHIVIIEVDEDQHKSYKCTAYGDTKDGKMKGENIRMFDIAQSFDGLPVIFIRYNPDNFKNKNNRIVKLPTTKRHTILIKWINKYFEMKWNNGLYVKYLFYDGYEESDASIMTIIEKDVI